MELYHVALHLFPDKLGKAFELIRFNLSQVEVIVSRDPSRLYKLTAGWEQRNKDGPGASGSGPSLHMPHRYVCTSSVLDVWYLSLFAMFSALLHSRMHMTRF